MLRFSALSVSMFSILFLMSSISVWPQLYLIPWLHCALDLVKFRHKNPHVLLKFFLGSLEFLRQLLLISAWLWSICCFTSFRLWSMLSIRCSRHLFMSSYRFSYSFLVLRPRTFFQFIYLSSFSRRHFTSRYVDISSRLLHEGSNPLIKGWVRLALEVSFDDDPTSDTSCFGSRFS